MLFSHGGILNNTGREYGFFEMGHLVYTGIILAVTLKIALAIDFWHWTTHVAVWGSVVVYYLFAIVFSVRCFH